MSYSVNRGGGGLHIRGQYVEAAPKDKFEEYVEMRTLIQSITSESSKVLDDMGISEFSAVLKSALDIRNQNFKAAAQMNPFIKLEQV